MGRINRIEGVFGENISYVFHFLQICCLVSVASVCSVHRGDSQLGHTQQNLF